MRKVHKMRKFAFALSVLALGSMTSLASAAGMSRTSPHQHSSDAAHTMKTIAVTQPAKAPAKETSTATTKPALTDVDQILLRRKASRR